jgi:predicted HTH transcriptional regulator
MTNEEIEALIRAKRETREVEFKSPLRWGNAHVNAKIAQAVMALANLRSGGLLVVGVQEKPRGVFHLVGLTDEQSASFNQDDVSRFVNEYASPFVEFRLDHVIVDDKQYVTLDVNEFINIPVVCRKSGPGDEKIGDEKEDKTGPLRQGAIYNRSRSINSSIEVASEAEMREILELALEKSVRRFYEQAASAGLTSRTEEQHHELFEQQLNGL